MVLYQYQISWIWNSFWDHVGECSYSCEMQSGILTDEVSLSASSFPVVCVYIKRYGVFGNVC